jgi:NAD+ synthase
MARVRMVVLYDFAKKLKGLVCGTENRSEYCLGYFTRFGDEASDIEPLQHLYKTQVYELAKYLGVPQNIIDKQPSANLWGNQTDENELGFSYGEADPVLYLYFDKKIPIEDIEKQGFGNAKKIIDYAEKNSYKHNAPYAL